MIAWVVLWAWGEWANEIIAKSLKKQRILRLWFKTVDDFNKWFERVKETLSKIPDDDGIVYLDYPPRFILPVQGRLAIPLLGERYIWLVGDSFWVKVKREKHPEIIRQLTI